MHSLLKVHRGVQHLIILNYFSGELTTSPEKYFSGELTTSPENN
jgi:hypothetical protein